MGLSAGKACIAHTEASFGIHSLDGCARAWLSTTSCSMQLCHL